MQEKTLNSHFEAFHQLRSELLNTVLLLMVWLALPAALVSVLHFRAVGWQPFMLIQWLVMLLLWRVVSGRKHLSYQARMYALLLATGVTSFSALVYLEPLAESQVLLAALPLFVMLFWDKRSGWLTVLLVFVTSASVGLAVKQAWLSDYEAAVPDALAWGLMAWIITAFSGIIAYTLLRMMNYWRGRLDVVTCTEHLLQELGNSIPDGAIYRLQRHIAGDGQFLYLSEAFADAFGLDMQGIKSDAQAFYVKILAEDLHVMQCLETISMRDLMPFEQVFRMTDRHGELRWVHGRAMPQRQADKSVIWNGVFLDVSERKIAEQQRQASERRLQQIIDSLPVGVAVIDAQDRILLLNRKFQQLFGYTVQDIHSIAELAALACPDASYRCEVLQTWQSDVQKAVHKQRETPTREYQICAKNKRVHHVEVTLAPGQHEHVACFVDISARRQVEASLHIYQQMVSSTKDMMAFLDRNLVYQKTNPAYAQAWGISHHQIVGKSVKDVLHDELIEQISPRLESSLNGNTERFQQWREFSIGLRFVDVVYTPYREAANNISGITVSIRDLTELQQAREALQHSEERLRSIIASINDLIFVQDAQGHYQDSYQKNDDRLLLPPERFWGKTHHDILPKPLCQQWEAAVQRIKAGETVQQFEYPLNFPHGLHWFSASMSGRYDAHGTFVGVTSVIRDITQHKQLEASLLESQQRLRFALDAAGAGTFYYDFYEDHNEWDAGSLEIFGVSPNDWDASLNGWFKHVHPNDVSPLRQHLQQIIAQQSDLFEHEYRIIRSTQQTCYIRSAGYMVRNTKEAIAISGLHFDISPQKHTELELIRAREKAEAASHAKSTFLANMSHELRTPLNAIMGYAQLLENQPSLTAQQSRMINTIYRSGDYLLTLITDILDLAKIEVGRLDILPVPCDLMTFILNLIDIFRMRAEQKNIRFTAEFAKNLPDSIEIDEKRLRQILMNLLSNAVKFTEQGEVKLHVDHQNNDLLLSVKDTGIGIAPEQQENIFEPFQQAGEPHYKAKGTGLGLAICRKLTKLMHGELAVASQLGHGSEFRLRLPAPRLSQSAMRHAQPAPRRRLLGYQSLNNRQRFQILVVDDVSDNRSMLRNLLESIGFSVEEVDSGEACLALVRQRRPDLILLDLRMPGIDGLETVRRLRALPATLHTPVIMISASVFEEEQIKTLEAGCNAYLIKPIQLEMLYTTLQTHLPLKWLYTQLPTHSPKAHAGLSNNQKQLSSQQAKELLELIKAGNLNHIKQFIVELDHSQCYPQLIHQLKDQLARFQLKDMKQCLMRFVDDEVAS